MHFLLPGRRFYEKEMDKPVFGGGYGIFHASG
jgi:hypothetical protein